MSEIETQKRVALCPECEAPHAYTQVRFRGGVNDAGSWRVTCPKGHAFLIDLANPSESYAAFAVDARFDAGDALPALTHAADQVVHDMPDSDYAPVFDYGAAALYRCATTGQNLELEALAALGRGLEGITEAYATAENFLCGKSAFRGRHAVARVPVPCPCGDPHVATFYCDFPSGFRGQPIETYQLADVTGVDLPDVLDGLFPKTDVMALLSKLLIRWHLTADRVIVAAPFVGTQWDNEDKRKARWSWLLAQLRPDQAMLITRAAAYKAFKDLKDGDVTYDLLQRYGLANSIVAADVRKQDFHAKFFIGLGPEGAEVLSGSANLMDGPSIENIAYRTMTPDRCLERYIAVMGVQLPPTRGRASQYVLIEAREGRWTSRDSTGWPLASPEPSTR